MTTAQPTDSKKFWFSAIWFLWTRGRLVPPRLLSLNVSRYLLRRTSKLSMILRFGWLMFASRFILCRSAALLKSDWCEGLKWLNWLKWINLDCVCMQYLHSAVLFCVDTTKYFYLNKMWNGSIKIVQGLSSRFFFGPWTSIYLKV